MEVLPTLDVGEAVVVGDATCCRPASKWPSQNTNRAATIPFWTRWAEPKTEVDLVCRRRKHAQAIAHKTKNYEWPLKKNYSHKEVAKAVGAGKTVALETVDFNDPNRPKTCHAPGRFPILPVNRVAVIEGNAGKPIYQMSKWWARRRSSVFRSMLIAAATKHPEDKSHAAKLVWDNYYANHQKKGAFQHLKVADIFMGGGTTRWKARASACRWSVTTSTRSRGLWSSRAGNVDLEVKRLLADIEAEVKPQIMPFYYCDGPEGEKGKLDASADQKR